MNKWYEDPQSVGSIYQSISESNDNRLNELALYLRAYSPTMVPTYLRDRLTTPIQYRKEGTKKNIINEICRHATNYFGRSFPKPVFLPIGGKQERDMADVSTKFVNGLFYEKDLYKQLRNALLIGTITGTGIIKTIETDDDIYYESILPSEIFLFDAEAEINNIRSIFQRQYIDTEILKTRFPKFKYEIETRSNSHNNQTTVIEGWHLPSGKKAKDGRHVLVIAPDIVVLDEKFDQEDFPFSFFKYIEPPVGFWGEGLGSILLPYQVKINQVLENVEANIRIMGNIKVYVDSDSGVSLDQFTNDLRGTIISSRGGKPPTVPIQPIVSPDLLRHLDYLEAGAWAASRFNRETQAGQVPTGITSNVALLTVQDMAAEALILTGKQWEKFILDIAQKTMDAAVRIQDKTGSISALFYTGKKVEKIALKDALTDSDKYRLEILPSSRLTDSISGRLEKVQMLQNVGIFGKEQVLEAMDMPGLVDDIDAELAESRNIDAYLTDLEKGIKRSPHPKLNLTLAKTKGLKRFNQLEYEQVDDDVLNLVSQWIDEVDYLLNKQAAEVIASTEAAVPATEPAPAMPEPII